MMEGKLITASDMELMYQELEGLDANTAESIMERILSVSEGSVTWAYEIWDFLVNQTSSKDNKVKLLAALQLCYLSQSNDPEKKVLNAISSILKVTYDIKPSDAKRIFENLWRIGKAGKTQESALMDALKKRYMDAISEKQTVLIRSFVLATMKALFDIRSNLTIKELALVLIGLELDIETKQKYLGIWS